MLLPIIMRFEDDAYNAHHTPVYEDFWQQKPEGKASVPKLRRTNPLWCPQRKRTRTPHPDRRTEKESVPEP